MGPLRWGCASRYFPGGSGEDNLRQECRWSLILSLARVVTVASLPDPVICQWGPIKIQCGAEVT